MDYLPIIVVIIICIVAIIAATTYKESFTNTEQGPEFTIKGMSAHYGAVPSNPDSAGNNTWATYERLIDIPEVCVPYYVVLPDMMHLPPLRNTYYTPVIDQKIDSISGILESMYTSPRVPLTDFKSETERDYDVYD